MRKGKLSPAVVSQTEKFLISSGENPFEHFRARIYLIISGNGRKLRPVLAKDGR